MESPMEEAVEKAKITHTRKRKKVSTRKRVKRPKVRGQHKQGTSKEVLSDSDLGDQGRSDNLEAQALPAIGAVDSDLIESIFSDDEERDIFLAESTVNCGHIECQHIVSSDDESVSSEREASSTKQSDLESVSTWSTASIEHSYSRPSSSQSAHTSRPSSAVSFHHSRPLSPTSIALPDIVNNIWHIACPEPFEFPVPMGPPCAGTFLVSAPESAESVSAVSDVPLDEFEPQSIPIDSAEPQEEYVPSNEVIMSSVSTLRDLVKFPWVPVADQHGIHLILVHSGDVMTVQRDVFVSYLGKAKITVHCQPLPFATNLLSSIKLPQIKLEENTVQEFCERAHSIAQMVSQYKICEGANHQKTRKVWENIPDSFIDTNPYLEESYNQTCRSLSCCWLIKFGNNVRCDSCHKVMSSLRRRSYSLLSDSTHPHTPNIYMSRQQILDKLNAQCEELKRKNSKIAYLTGKIFKLLEKEGVDVDSELSDDLNAILANAKLSDVQKMFLREQLLCSGKYDPRAHRWHPTMIRFALHLKMTSSSAYDSLRDSGMIKLPCNRTLYDYSHAFKAKPGVSTGMLKIAAKKVANSKEDYQKYVCLLFDEMYISKNLTYRQATNTIVGYVHLDQVEKEMINFDNFLTGKESELQLPLASKILAYMVKGITSNLKCVVAAFPVSTLSKDMLYCRTWEVIGRLERAGIRVLCLVCDGSSVNRAFIDMHTPVTQCSVVFDTINWCSPDDRVLYFMSDVAHLIKTIRNCFYNSGEGPKKARCLGFNGQKILWKTIVKLYFTYKQCTLRKSFKLNAQNVFPNSYSCMNVKHAITVLSETVATDIELQKWTDTSETVKFIRRWNKFFDCLNGLHSNEHLRKKNADLAPYKDVNDPRFAWLQSCVEHLEEWKKQASQLKVPLKDQERSMLSHQTRHGIEMTIRGFTGATKFMLERGAKFIMARDFSQDHLENYFSRQRGRGGGSTNPSEAQFLNQQVAMGIHSELGIPKKGGNVQIESKGLEVSTEPVAKRLRRTRKKT